MATDTARVLDTLGKMTVLELVELKKAIEEEWGVTAAAPVAVAATGAPPAGAQGGEGEKDTIDGVVARGGEAKRAAAGARAEGEEKDSCAVVRAGGGQQKIAVIKAARAATGLGLKEA